MPLKGYTMSIVAYHNGTVVGDRRVIVNCDYSAFPEFATTAPKVFKSECGKYLLGVVGAALTAEDAALFFTSATTLFESIFNLADRSKWPLPVRQLCMLDNRSFVLSNGTATLCINTHKAHQEANFDHLTVVRIPGNSPVFLGTGDAIAQYAFASGLSLEAAVALTFELEPLCGGGIDVLALDSPVIAPKRRGRKS